MIISFSCCRLVLIFESCERIPLEYSGARSLNGVNIIQFLLCNNLKISYFSKSIA